MSPQSKIRNDASACINLTTVNECIDTAENE